jgi:superoxide dismutase, Fe-Mn family
MKNMKFELPKLNYSYSALEPYIDRETMTIHHLKHHQGYITKLNSIIEANASLQGVSAEFLLTNLKTVNPEIRQAVANFAGGHVNHSFFWKTMTPGKTKPGKLTKKVLTINWGGVEKFLEDFTSKALGVFGSGWTWLVVLNNQFEVTTTFNQDSPLTLGQTPVLGLDVWEHAYYLKYQNRRDDYIKAWWNVVDWGTVETNLLKMERGPP